MDVLGVVVEIGGGVGVVDVEVVVSTAQTTHTHPHKPRTDKRRQQKYGFTS